MKSLLALTVVSIAAVSLLAGCKPNKEAQLVGKWKFQDINAPSASSNPNATAGVAMIKAFMGSSTLEFNKDKTYKMTMIIPLEGQWTIDEGTITMTPKTIMGMTTDKFKEQALAAANGDPAKTAQLKQADMSKPTTATLSDDGKTLSLGSKAKGVTMTFTKEAS